MIRKILKFRTMAMFRELFLYHHNSLEFRAKLFSLVIAANPNAGECEFEALRKIATEIYSDEDRAQSLVMITGEMVSRIQHDKTHNLDHLVEDIVRDLTLYPRYHQKIVPEFLEPLIECAIDEASCTYQIRIIEFLKNLKSEHG